MLLFQINGESVAGLNHADVVDKFRKAKKAVCLKVIHGEEERLKVKTIYLYIIPYTFDQIIVQNN